MLLVMLHTGTMFAVIVYFWNGWRRDFFHSAGEAKAFLARLIVATVCSIVVYKVLEIALKHLLLHNAPGAEIETLFSNVPLVASGLAAAGILIVYAGFREDAAKGHGEIGMPQSFWMGIVQGICIPFRGFSRSGATISTGMLFGLPKKKVEEFSFAMGVAVTPGAIYMELHRLIKAQGMAGVHATLSHTLGSSLVGMLFSFIAGLLALKWLSGWLEGGRWKLFGFYCLAASAAVFALHFGMVL